MNARWTPRDREKWKEKRVPFYMKIHQIARKYCGQDEEQTQGLTSDKCEEKIPSVSLWRKSEDAGTEEKRDNVSDLMNREKEKSYCCCFINYCLIVSIYSSRVCPWVVWRVDTVSFPFVEWTPVIVEPSWIPCRERARWLDKREAERERQVASPPRGKLIMYIRRGLCLV